VKRLGTSLLAAALLAGAPACSDKPSPGPSTGPTTPASATTLATQAAAPPDPPGDPARGKELVAKFECNRCHDGTGHEDPAFEKQCFHCHEQIISGKFKTPKSAEKKWKERVADLQVAPTLTDAPKRLRREWVAKFLLEPYDLRPRLSASMPRLKITPAEARDIAAHLGAPDDPPAADPLAGADLGRGRSLIEDKGCPSCHEFSGVPALKGAAPVKPREVVKPAVELAPDLRSARDRLKPAAVIAWLTSPKSMKSDTLMPEFSLTPAEARDIAAYVLHAELAPISPRAAPARLPVLTRKVSYDEVNERVFRRTCWHCHGEPEYAAGDGGPGNTGGMGFKPRGLSFLDYASVHAGATDDDGSRHSIFEKVKGTPRVVAALLARQAEEAGHPDAELRGMPLGYPALTPEEVQLVESWVEQGRPR
jgi:cytochrome c5